MRLVQAARDRRTVTAFTAALALTSCAVGAAGAGTTRSADFCSVSKSVAQELVNLQAELQSAPASTSLEAKFAAISAAEPALRSSAPSKLKQPVIKLLAFANTIGRYLRAAHWNVAGLILHEATLSAQESKTQPSVSALTKYWRGTCHFEI
jgi:hypothetical protein